MREDPEEHKRKVREYTAMIRRNNPEEIAEYKRKREEQKAATKAKYANKEWRNAYHYARRASFPSEIKRKEAALSKKLEKEKLKALKLEKNKNKKLKNKKIQKIISNIRSVSAQFCRRNIKTYDGNLYNVHHIFGWSKYSFIILNKEDHIMLHKKYGWDNDKVSWFDEKIRNEVLHLPYCLVINKNIVKNNLF